MIIAMKMNILLVFNGKNELVGGGLNIFLEVDYYSDTLRLTKNVYPNNDTK